MTIRILERIKSYLAAKEGFTVLESHKTAISEKTTIVDALGFVYAVEVTPVGRISTEPLKLEA